MAKKRQAFAPKWQYVGLGALAVVTFGVVGLAVLEPKAPAPTPASVATYSAPAKTAAPTPVVAVIGDSYAAGAGAGDPAKGWVSRLAFNQAWQLSNFARGGTGYTKAVTADAMKACGLSYCPSYPDMIKDVAAAAPSMVIVAGGRNDAGIPAGDESEAVKAFYQQLRAALPTAKIVAFNPWWDSTNAPAAIGAISADVKASVEAVGGTYIDAGQPLAAHPELIASDNVHPNAAGHAAIFDAALPKLQAAGLAIK